ncbi:MAG: PTS sugar transporter subunit IIB [Erysipelotrichaceae bacterium]
MNFRVDDRLIHGIVAAYWVNLLKATRIMVIDDESANNSLMKSSLRMACPKSVNLSVLTYEKAINNIKAGNYEGQEVFVITKTPKTYEKMQRDGISIPFIVMGNITYSAERIKVCRTVSVNQEEIESLKILSENNTKIISQLVPSDTPLDFMESLNNVLK